MYVVAKHSFCYYGYNLKLKFSLEKAIPKLRIWICNAYVSNLCEITEGRKIHEKKMLLLEIKAVIWVLGVYPF